MSADGVFFVVSIGGNSFSLVVSTLVSLFVVFCLSVWGIFSFLLLFSRCGCYCSFTSLLSSFCQCVCRALFLEMLLTPTPMTFVSTSSCDDIQILRVVEFNDVWYVIYIVLVDLS